MPRGAVRVPPADDDLHVLGPRLADGAREQAGDLPPRNGGGPGWVRPASFLHTVPISDQQFSRSTEPRSPDALSRARQWSREHRVKLLVAGDTITAAVVALRVRGGNVNGNEPVVQSALTAAKDAAESAAAASTRVADEFHELGRDYTMAAMHLTVGQAGRRHQRWTEEELSVLRDGDQDRPSRRRWI